MSERTKGIFIGAVAVVVVVIIAGIIGGITGIISIKVARAESVNQAMNVDRVERVLVAHVDRVPVDRVERVPVDRVQRCSEVSLSPVDRVPGGGSKVKVFVNRGEVREQNEAYVAAA